MLLRIEIIPSFLQKISLLILELLTGVIVADSKVEVSNAELLRIFNLHAFLKTITFKNYYKPSATYTIKQTRTKRFKTTETNNNNIFYNDLRYYLTFALQEEKKCHIHHQICLLRSNPEMLWVTFPSGKCSTTTKNVSQKL